MKIMQKHFEILKDFLDNKIKPEDIEKEDRIIVLELCKARRIQIYNKIDMVEKELRELNNELKK